MILRRRQRKHRYGSTVLLKNVPNHPQAPSLQVPKSPSSHTPVSINKLLAGHGVAARELDDVDAISQVRYGD